MQTNPDVLLTSPHRSHAFLHGKQWRLAGDHRCKTPSRTTGTASTKGTSSMVLDLSPTTAYLKFNEQQTKAQLCHGFSSGQSTRTRWKTKS